MTHTNLTKFERKIREGWVQPLNWRPKPARAQLTVPVGQLQGPRAYNATFSAKDAERFKVLIDAWLSADRSFQKMFLSRKDAEDLNQHLQSMRAFFAPAEDGGLVPWIDDTAVRPFHVAIAQFLRIAAHPERWRLSGPCPTCRKYFLQKTRRPQKYCPHCRRSESGPRMKVARERKHETLLSIVREVRAKCPQGCKDWKAWTVERVNQRILRIKNQKKNRLRLAPITRWSLTRWMRKRELLSPLAHTIGGSRKIQGSDEGQ